MEAVMTYAQSFFGWLLQTTLIGSLVICLILLIQKILGGKLGPRWSHALWLILLIRMILPWAPSSRLSLSNLIPSWDRQIQQEQPSEVTEQQEPSDAGQTSETSETKISKKPESENAIQTSVAPEPSMIAHTEREPELRLTTIRRILPVLWLVGVVVIGAYLLMSNFALWRIVKRDSPLVDQPMLELFEECKSQMGIQSLVAVVPSDRVRSPGLFGFVRPRLLLPREMLDSTTQEEMEYVFLHELAHLRRHDIYLGWLMSLLQVLHWFNPLVWFAFYRMRADRELACDALVLTRTQKGESQEYGQAIVSLVRRFSRSRPLPAMAGIIESKSQLKRRITMIAKYNKSSYKWSPLAVILIIILACVSLPDAKRTTAATQDAHAAPPISVRQVWSGPLVFGLLGEPSPDGKYISYVDWESGDLAIYEIATGKKRRLTNKGPWYEANYSALESRWSPDGTQIAYAQETETGSVDLRIVGLDGSDPRIFYSLDDQTRWIELCAWFPDGRHVLAHRTGKDGTDQIVRISNLDGSLKVLKTVGKDCLGHVVFSPDGKYIAYDIKQEADEHTATRDIRLVSTDGTHEIPLVEHPADDAVLGWAPDGRHILFASDRVGTQGAWLVAVSKGAPQGTPKFVRSGGLAPLGFTRDGSFYYGHSRMGSYVYVATLDSKTGKILDAPEKTPLRYEGRTVVSAYSPDGKYLAYACELTSMVRRSHDPTSLCIRSLESGRERQFPIDLHLYSGSEPRWSPDCSTLLIGGKDLSNREGLFRIDARSGDIEPVVMSEGENEFDGYDWAHDGNSVFYSYTSGQIVLHNLDTGKTEEIWPASPAGTRTKISVSPDGTRLAIMIRQSKDETRYIKVISATGGEMRELLKFEKEDPIAGSVTWTADGKNILFASKAREQNDWELCQIPAEGGQVQKLGPDGTWWGWMNCLSVHPDGRRIAFRSSGPTPGHGEVWVMDNFLPGESSPVAKPEPAMTLRKLKEQWGGFANISPDGKYLCDVDWDAGGNLLVRELANGRQWSVSKKGSLEESIEYALDSAISPDNESIAYLWYDPNTENTNLYTIGLDGSGRKLLRRNEYLVPRDWSSDGKRILGILFGKPKEMVWVSSFDGSIQRIKAVGEGYPGKFDVSPDGRYIAYDLPQEEGSEKRDIFVFAIDENREIPLVYNPAHDRLLGWTPDGKHIFFASDRMGSWDGWLLNVVDGKPKGLPELVKSEIGDIQPIGFTSKSDYYFGIYHNRYNIYTAMLDLWAGKGLSAFKTIGYTGTENLPDWSPDGQYLAYCTGLRDDQVIRIRSLDTGQECELDPNLPFFYSLCWSPDGQSLLASGFRGDKGIPQVIYKVDAQTGEHTALSQIQKGEIRQAKLSPDGRSLFYKQEESIVVKDLVTGREKEIFKAVPPMQLRGWALSPDGQRLVFSLSGTKGSALKTIPVIDGEPSELLGEKWLREKQKNEIRAVTWMHDSQSVLFRINWQGEKRGDELWWISAEGGEPQKLWASKKPFGWLRVHPDGQRIAFTQHDLIYEMWVMENFLPKDVGK